MIALVSGMNAFGASDSGAMKGSTAIQKHPEKFIAKSDPRYPRFIAFLQGLEDIYGLDINKAPEGDLKSQEKRASQLIEANKDLINNWALVKLKGWGGDGMDYSPYGLVWSKGSTMVSGYGLQKPIISSIMNILREKGAKLGVASRQTAYGME